MSAEFNLRHEVGLVALPHSEQRWKLDAMSSGHNIKLGSFLILGVGGCTLHPTARASLALGHLAHLAEPDPVTR